MSARQDFTRVAAYGLIIDDDRVLLCRLSARVPNAVGQWTLPGGGLDFGEDPVDAMVREVREETGYEVQSGDLIGVDSICTDTPYGRMHSIRIVYRATVVGGALRPEIDGSTDLCDWFTQTTLPANKMVDLARRFVPLRS